MQITINVPDWMANDYEVRTGAKFDAARIEMAARAYYGRLNDPMYNRNLPQRSLVALFGHDDDRY
ncbi:MAG: hypothetical protein EPN74_00685 [Rhodanobacter sp.]|nr:MAG: hypothetical protein EPN74_00685 [Rhodanobacter sp.]